MNLRLSLLLVVILCSFQTISFAQKIKLDKKTDVISIDGVDRLKIERSTWDFSVQDLEGNEIAYLVFQEYKDRKEISKSNPTGRVTYFELTFEGVEGMTEVVLFWTKKQLTGFLLKHELIDLRGQVQKETVAKYIKRNGQKYSRKREELK
ncbi:MAG: hypothetical protein GY810_12155 [Aureispira sp.]|nr:hypothetical protein [Aureispira sp.]